MPFFTAARALLALTTASPVAPPETSDLAICLHAWVGDIEAIDGGRVTRLIRNGCQDEPLFNHAFKFSALALARFPHCGRLSPKDYRNDFTRMEACLQLKGEELQAAAEVRNRFSAMDIRDTAALRGVCEDESRAVRRAVLRGRRSERCRP